MWELEYIERGLLKKLKVNIMYVQKKFRFIRGLKRWPAWRYVLYKNWEKLFAGLQMSKIAQESASRHNVLQWVHRQAKSRVVGIFLVCVLQKICVWERFVKQCQSKI